MSKRNYTRKPNDFFAKYKHPLWQEKRLKVMDEAGFKCSRCKDEESTLNVHHISYLKGRDPWEYENNELVCLCEGCHAEMHDAEDRLKAALHEFKVFDYFLNDGYGVTELAGYLAGRTLNMQGPFRIKPHDDDGWLQGFLEAFNAHSTEFKKDTTDPGEFTILRELISADDGFIDYEWLKIYARDVLPTKYTADDIKKNGFYCPKKFPNWYSQKVDLMVVAWEGIEE